MLTRRASVRMVIRFVLEPPIQASPILAILPEPV
jgi:hypothetical protein